MNQVEHQTSRARGSVRAEHGHGVVRMEDDYATTVDDLWSAVTDPGRLSRWIADVDGDLRAGGRFEARFTSGWEGPGRVDVCEPPRHLLVTMAPGGEDETVIEAWLEATGETTRLVVEERGIPLPELAAHGAGWQVHVEDLGKYIEGRDGTEWRTRWEGVIAAYEAQLRP